MLAKPRKPRSETASHSFESPKIGDLQTELIEEFFKAFVQEGRLNFHVEVMYGRNQHHIAETIFKAFGRAVRMALAFDPRMQGVMPSTKGSL